MFCTDCEFLSSDSWFDIAWWICVHDEWDNELDFKSINKSIFEKPITPIWCPILEERKSKEKETIE